MANNKFYNKDMKPNEEMSLGDEQRIRVLSPTALVLKRFFRNRLAITGLIFIIGMFLFSYVGGWIMPYDEDQVFTKYDEMYKVYAGITVNEELKFIVAEEAEFPLVARSQFVLAVNREEPIFESDGAVYMQQKVDDDYHLIHGANEVGISMTLGKEIRITTTDHSLGENFEEAAVGAVKNEDAVFTYDGKTYLVSYRGKNNLLYEAFEIALATKNVYDYHSGDIENSFPFCRRVEDSIRGGYSPFVLDGVRYAFNDVNGITEIVKDGQVYANVSRYQIEPFMMMCSLTWSSRRSFAGRSK